MMFIVCNHLKQAAIQNASTLEEVNRIEQQLKDHPSSSISSAGDTEMKVIHLPPKKCEHKEFLDWN